MRFILLSFLLWLTAIPAFASQSLQVDTGKVTSSLISSHDSVAPGDSFYIALRTELDEHWHTYWRNPGDSGEPVYIEWTLPAGVSAGDIQWPIPKPVPTGPIVNYGFEGVPLFPVKFSVDPSVEPGTVIMVDAAFYYLVCKDVCIPEQGKASLPIAVGEAKLDIKRHADIETALSKSPVKGNVQGAIQKTGKAVKLTFTDLPDGDFENAYFFPFEQGVLNHSAPQPVSLADKGLQIESLAEFLWDEPLPDNFDGVLSFQKDGELVATELSLAVGERLDIGAIQTVRPDAVQGGNLTLMAAIFGALIGGLILNLMPCVFPVISMKALSLAKSAHNERTIIRREAWLYTAGVLATFLLLTVIILLIKAGGAEIGWGFQLQSPVVVAGLAILLFLIGLNLIGVFEFGGSMQNIGSELTQGQNGTSAFFTGALAVIVATPCTAPLMAGAIGYALAQPAYVTIIVFMALGLGFASPFLLLAYVPRLLSRLPKPGPWMVRFKEFLAFPMFGAAIWLVWVYSLQAGDKGLLTLLSSLLLIAFAIWLLKRKSGVAKGLAVVIVIAALILPIPRESKAMETAEWSPELISTLQEQGQGVFVDFTAAWCVTCKVNEIAVLSQSKTQKLFIDTDTAFLVADWTNKNDTIAQELERFGRVGIPLYLYYPPKNVTSRVDSQNSVSPVILPQILTYDMLYETLQGDKT